MAVDPVTYTIEQAAEALQVSASLVRQLVQRRELPSVHLGDRVLIPISALATFLDERALEAVRRDAVVAYLTGLDAPTPIASNKNSRPAESPARRPKDQETQ